MKQHRDFVIYRRNGVDINALVVFAHDVFTPATQTKEAFTTEYLTLVYLEPGLASTIPSGDQIRNNIKTEFSVPPLVEGLTRGWKDIGVADADDVPEGFTLYASDGQKPTIADLEYLIDNIIPTYLAPSGKVYVGPKPNSVPSSPGDGADYPTFGEDSEARAREAFKRMLEGISPNIASGGTYQEDGGNLPQGVATNPVFTNENISGPDGLTDEQRGFKWGSPEHVVVITKPDPVLAEEVKDIPAEDIVQPDPEVVAAVNKANLPETPAIEPTPNISPIEEAAQ